MILHRYHGRLAALLVLWAAVAASSLARPSAQQAPVPSSARSTAPSTAPSTAAPAPRQAGAPPAAAPADYSAVVDKYCVSCHNDRTRTANLSLQGRNFSRIAEDGATWEKVARKVATGSMPPAGMPRPDAAVLDGLVTMLEMTLDRAAAARPNPGAPVIHRLNRAEYGNVIRDLLDVEFDVTALLPPDNSSEGFDNMADALGVSPVLLERYLAAAEKISAVAVGDPQIGIDGETFVTRGDSHQWEHIEGLPLGTRGGLLIRRTFPVDGEYEISVKLYKTNGAFTRGLVHPHELEILVDGERVFLNTVGTREDYLAVLGNPAASYAIDSRLKVRVPIKAGPRSIGVTFVDKTNARNPTLLRPVLGASDPVDADGVPRVDSVLVAGPYSVSAPGDSPSRRRIFTCRPAAGASAAVERTCARRIMGTLAATAFRRPVAAAEVDEFLTFFDAGRRERGTFDGGIQLAVRRLLSDPVFLFRIEREPGGGTARAPFRIADLDLASRLSFFLWSSIPDQRLLQQATGNRLREAAVLRAEVRRMLDDPKSAAFVASFAGQWLQLRNLQRAQPDPQEFPDFDDNLRQAFRTETEMLFAAVVAEDRSVLDLLTADYTFVNERLARHYGMANVYGTQFRRVSVASEMRRGLLGHGSVQTVTSYPNRTSPVKRGKWILENLMGSPPPPPPPNVPPLKEKAALAAPQTMKARMVEHRANPTCANCHRLMDPLGLAMENFDGTGAYRERDGVVPIDPSAELADGTGVAGIADLRQALLRRPETFVRTLTEKMLTYALGRGLTHEDMPAVRAILRQARQDDYRFSSILMGIVTSTPFQMRTRMPIE